MGEREPSWLRHGLHRGRRPIGILSVAIVVLAAGLGTALAVDALEDGADPGLTTAVAAAGTVAPTTTAPEPPTTTTTTTAPTTTAAPTTVPPTTAAPTTQPPPPAPRFTLDPYRGLGTWIDVYDWSITFARGIPPLEPDAVDRMAAMGVRTLYVQAAKWDGGIGVLEPERLQLFIDRAHANGMDVVVWYLPTLLDTTVDLMRLLAISELDVEGIGVDIESREVGDPAERNRRLVELSERLRAHLPGQVLSAIVLPPVVMEDINPNYWPGFPWAELAPYYDVWQPMAYWTFRRPDSGWRDGYAYTAANIDRVRERIGRLDAPVHSIGGIADAHGAEDVVAMAQASLERGALGGSLYDFRTIEANAARDAIWAAQAAFNPSP